MLFTGVAPVNVNALESMQTPTAMGLSWHLGDVVRKLRYELGYKSQGDLARRAGVHLTTISNLEQKGAEASSPETIRKVAAAFGLREGDLYNLVPTIDPKHKRKLAG